MTGHEGIYWLAPSQILTSFAVAIALAVGHHYFYEHLSGQIAPTGSYTFGHSNMSKQQLNIAIGTAFAFAFKAVLAWALASSYTQLFWRVLKTSLKAVRVGDADAAFSLLHDILAFFRASTWRRQYLVLVPIATIFWLIPIASIITPATLSVRSALVYPFPIAMTPVPQIDWMNQNFYRTLNYPGEKGLKIYAGPMYSIHRIVAATMSQGDFLAIRPPAFNSSWALNFWGPAIRCGEVSGPDRTSISNNYGAYVQQQLKRGIPSIYLPSYFAWANGLLPFEVFGSVSDMRIDVGRPSKKLDPATLFIAYNYKWGFSTINDVDLTNNATVRALGGWTEIFRNITLLGCDLYNSSYLLDLNYTNGVQETTITRPEAPSSDVSLSTDTQFYAPDDMDQTWDWSCTSGSTDPHCFDATKAKLMSYQAVNDAFNFYLVGQLTSRTWTGDSSVVRSVLTDTDELAFIRHSNVMFNLGAFTGNTTARPLTSERLRDSLERLYENVVVSILSDPFLQ